MLEHGGRLRAAARRYAASGAGDPAAWLDLSTGINPCAYPVAAIDPACWRRLPEDDDGLDEVAAGYYGSAHLLALHQGAPTLVFPETDKPVPADGLSIAANPLAPPLRPPRS